MDSSMMAVMGEHLDIAVDYGVPRSEADHAAIDAIVGAAFSMSVEKTRSWLTFSGRDELRVMRQHGEVAGCLLRIPMGQYFGSTSMRSVGVACVAVRPDRLRQGIAQKMFTEFFRESRDEGFIFSTLHASAPSLYRKLGYGEVSLRYDYSFPAPKLKSFPVPEGLRWATADDRPRAEAFYHQQAQHRMGAIDRGWYIHERAFGLFRGEPAQGLLLEDDEGNLRGYVYYRVGQSSGRFEQKLRISDFEAIDVQAARELWGAIARLNVLVADIELPSGRNDMAFEVLELPNVWFGDGVEQYLRILDPIFAIEHRRDWVPDGELSLRINDSEITENNGAIKIVVREGQRHVEPCNNAELEMDSRSFANLYAGYTSPAFLSRCGRLSGTRDAMQRLALCFPQDSSFQRIHY